MTETITARSGFKLKIEKRADDRRLEIVFRSDKPRSCWLHWGLRRPDVSEWLLPPHPLWPKGTRVFGPNAVQSPFFLSENGHPSVVIRLSAPVDYSHVEFVLFFPDQDRWDNNNGKNYQVRLSGPEPASVSPPQELARLIDRREVCFQHNYDLSGVAQLAVAVVKAEHRYQVLLCSNLPGPLVLHWGVAHHYPHEWFLPSVDCRPPGTVLWQNASAQTPFAETNGLRQMTIEFSAAAAPLGIQFVLLQPALGRWWKDGSGNFCLLIHGVSQPSATALTEDLAKLAAEIIQAEVQRNSWSLMHRFQLCHDLLDRVRHHPEGLALVFVWLRFSAIRQLTWQRNYNTKPRELGHAQDRLTQKLALLCLQEPDGRPWIRLLLASVGRGGEGQQIRDEILNIMHRHHVKEVTGHFLEEWHQKLHNNTTPDDVVICEAYLEFLRSEGNRDRFYQSLRNGGVTRERLESFERPIRTAPDYVPHLKEGLIHDFQNFLKILKAIHSGTDLEAAINTARHHLDGDTQHLLTFLWQHRCDPQVPLVNLMQTVTEARHRLSHRLGQESAIRDLLYLDLALEQFVRVAVESSLHLDLSRDQLADLITRTLENLLLTQSDAEFSACLSHWKRLQALPRFAPDWSLHARAVLDRVNRRLTHLIDAAYQTLQPKAELLGQAFHADTWAITLFSEEVVRGASLGFVLAALLHHLDPHLRQSAQIGHWQIISRGSARGVVELVDSLREIQGKTFDRPRIVVANHVMGDEEIPPGVTAVIAPDVTDIVSHVAVRARNAQLLFAACYDGALLQQLRSLRGHTLQLEINPAGDVVFAEAALDEPRPQPRVCSALSPRIRPEFKTYSLAGDEFTPDMVGAKSYHQATLRRQLPAWIHQPVSVALPFGVFERVLSDEPNRMVAAQYAAWRDKIEADPEQGLALLRNGLRDLTAPAELVSSLQSTLKQAGLPWPESWEDAWACIKRVWASKWNLRAFLSRQTHGLAHEDLCMAVLIQNVIEAEYAFVIHTVNPFNGRREELYAELVLGLGETLVGNYPGRALSMVASKTTRQPTLMAYPGKSAGLYGGGLIFRSDSNGEDIPGYAGAGLYDSVLLSPPREVLLDYTHEPLLWDPAFRQEILGRLVDIGLEIERICGAPQDIEGAYVKGEFYVVQSRPQVGV